MQRTDRIALLVGACLSAAYVLIAALGTLWHQSPRPLYDGPCPPTVCTPCPGFQCSYTTSTQTPPPSSTTTHTTTQTTQTSTTQPATTHSTTNASSTTAASSTTSAPGSSTSSGTSPPPASASGSSPAASNAVSSSTSVAAPPGTPSSAVIGPGGGVLASDGGELAVLVPAGALTTSAMMRVLSAEVITPGPPPGRSKVGHAWDIDGSGTGGAGPVTTFATPIKVTLHYSDTDPEFLFYWDGSSWNALQTTVDSGARTATATVPHLTVFAAFTATGASSSSGGGGGAAVAVVLVVVLVGVVAAIAVVSRRRAGNAG